MIRAIAMARAVVGHIYRERAVPVACWPSTIYGCSYELSVGLTTRPLSATAGEETSLVPVSEREIKRVHSLNRMGTMGYTPQKEFFYCYSGEYSCYK